MSLIEKALRAYLTKSINPLGFRKPSVINPVFNNPAGLYLHIPLCKNCCPFCPYIKEKFSSEKADLIFESVKREIEIFSAKCGPIITTSLYIGGGSPLSIGLKLGELVNCFTRRLNFQGPVAIEVYPGDVNSSGIDIIESCRASMISLGVQSFDDNVLKTLHRQHSATTAKTALDNLSKKSFDSLNVDLLFAIEGQGWESVENDLKCARDHGATQITCYPLFTFPFTEIGQYLNLKKVKLPSFAARKDIYYRINDWCRENGFHRTSVWSFTRCGYKTFSSVTRENFAGFGPSAGSYNGNQFYFNTFNINEYAKNLAQGLLPVALKMDVTFEIQRLFWIYWRFYQTEFDTVQYDNKFGRRFYKDFKFPFFLLKLMQWVENDSGSKLRLTTKGSHWLHLLQNIIALNYMSKIWVQMKECAWPSKVSL
jgi:coproporphyrinogen III oxidase-like Fe-S oxidoreductase